MKTYLRNQEKTLLLIMTILYWTIFFAICWFSFDSVVQFVVDFLSQTDNTMISGAHQVPP